MTLKDGGEVALDWLETNCDENSPIVIVLPGLTGESQAEYIKCLVTAGNKIHVRCCVFNNRGLGGIALKTPRLYCAANCEDLSEVVKHVQKHNPNIKIGATGISMGGLILGKNTSHRRQDNQILINNKLMMMNSQNRQLIFDDREIIDTLCF